MADTVCVFDGDGAAPEAVQPTVDLLKLIAPSVPFETLSIDQFVDNINFGTAPGPIQDRVDDADAVLFGAASDTHVPILRYLRYELDGGLPANVRPVRSIESAATPLERTEPIDYVIVRQNLEGLYARIEGELADLDDCDSLADSPSSISILRRVVDGTQSGQSRHRKCGGSRDSPASWPNGGPAMAGTGPHRE